MKKVIVVLLLLASVISFAQTGSVQKAIPTGLGSVSPTWGNEIQISSFRPIGPVAGVRAGNGTIYIAVNDTLATANLGMVIYKSTNNGVNWTMNAVGIAGRQQYGHIRMICTGAAQDSVYAMFQIGSVVYCWNIATLTSVQVNPATPYRLFDAVGSMTGNTIYIFLDYQATNQVYNFGSIDGGYSWIGQGYMSSSAAQPKLSITPGDTVFINYYTVGTGGTADTVSGPIRIARYRQTSPGTLAAAGFITLTSEAVPKNEFQSAGYNGDVWFLYTVGSTGNIDIKGMKSTNSGSNYNAAVDVAANPNVDEYWFDIKYFTTGTGGFDFVCYSDSLQGGSPTNNTDKLLYKYSNIGSANFTGTSTSIAHHPPFWASANFKPRLIELLPTSDVGAIWVGLDGTAGKLYWDRFLLATNINPNNSLASDYRLSQNYPNPFNPSTKIEFSIPINGFVNLKVFDILGREVATLISKNMNAGSYTVDFDGSRLSSGTYFYKFDVNGFTDIKRMILSK